MIGRREWLALPELGIDATKVKTDTGTRTNALYVEQVERFAACGRSMLHLVVGPLQRVRGTAVPWGPRYRRAVPAADRPAPIRADGRKRPPGIPTVWKRVAQMAAKWVLEPTFEADFLPC